MSKSIHQIQDEIIEEFSLLEGDMEMATFYIMELGQKLPPFEEQYQLEENLVKGCQSKVWMFTELQDNKVIFQAESNSAITKGLVSLLIRIFNHQTPNDILDADLYFIDKIGMNRFIGTQRSNGFAAMIKHIKLTALVYQNQLASAR
jgi:cysteine desulfuration protein SufE